MALSNDLLSQYVKVTKKDNDNKKETILYGTVVDGIEFEPDGTPTKVTVKLDGTEETTPVSSTSYVEAGDRVIVMIKNHAAVITGNITKPSSTTIQVVKTIETSLLAQKVAKFDNLIADKVSTEELAVEQARIKKLETDVADIQDLSADLANIGELNTRVANIEEANVKKLDAEVAKNTYATIENLDAANAEIEELDAKQGKFERATATQLEAVDASIKDLYADKLSANDIEGKYANIDFSNIGKAAIELFFAKSGLIEDVVVGDGTVTGHLVGVTISGDLIEGNTVKADKLVIKGDDGLYYKLNTDGVTTEAEQTDENSLNGSIIKAKSITATKISVSDLVAFGATIGGINIADGALYSGVKESVDNNTAGVYLDKNGQMAVGDANTYIKYYIDANGVRRLEISAGTIRFGTKNKTIEEAVDDVKIGGRNLYIEKESVGGYLSSNGDGGITAPGGVTREKTSGFIPVEEGDIVQFQLWVTVPADSYVWYGHQFYGEDLLAFDNNRPDTHRYELTDGTYHVVVDPIVVPAGVSYLRVSARMFNDGKIKVEKGTKTTDWTPAPEDMATSDEVGDATATAEGAHTRIAEVETLIELLSETISMLVTDGNGASLMTQTENGWTFSTGDLQDLVNQTSEKLNNLESTVGDVDNTVDILKQSVADLGIIAEYVKIGTYEGEPCIELGEGDSDFKLVITNTRIMFKEGSGVPAYFNNQSMHIKKAVIEEDFQQGGFVWKVRSNGNMGLVWRGGTS